MHASHQLCMCFYQTIPARQTLFLLSPGEPSLTAVLIMFVFVLETIRTSTMRVIHIIVKTEQTQKLRIIFVLYVLPEFKLKQNLSFHLSTDRQIWQRVDISTLGLKTWGLRCRRSQRFVLQSPTQVRTKREVRHRISPCMDFAHWTTAPLEVCLAVANPYQRRSSREIRHRISPCMDFANWTTASLEVCLAVAKPKEGRRERNPISHLSVRGFWTIAY